MGRGSYQASDWLNLCSSRGLHKSAPAEKVFTDHQVSKEFDVHSVAFREARDSEDSPQSTPVIIGFDVTASMGYLAAELAVNALNRTVQTLLKEKPILCPQVLCSAIGDSRCDAYPLQVTQFESDIRMVEQLTRLYLEGGGGGNGGESYHLLWYFAAHHTVMDCYEKRHKKGYLFTIGDDNCHTQLLSQEIQRVFGDACLYGYTNEKLLKEVQQYYEVFHIHIESDRSCDAAVFSSWRSLLDGHAVRLHRKDIHFLADLLCAMISVSEGQNLNAVLKRMDQSAAERIAPSMALVSVQHTVSDNKTISF